MTTFAFSPEAINAAHQARIDGKDIRDVLAAAFAIELNAGRLTVVRVPAPEIQVIPTPTTTEPQRLAIKIEPGLSEKGFDPKGRR